MSEAKLSDADKTQLLTLARSTIKHKLTGEPIENGPADNERLSEPRGAFVTLHKQGQLRGCIGTFTSKQSLADTIEEMAISASQQDPRFNPVHQEELADIDIEISALTPLRPIENVSEIEVGTHGIYITRGYRSGVLLPQVATEQGWDREQFLQHTCIKAGLPPDAWQAEETKIEIFSAEVFGEKEA